MCLMGWRSDAEPVELLQNGGFEDVEKDVPTAWTPSNCGELVPVTDAHSGKLAAQFTAREHEWGYCYFATNARAISGATFRGSIWAKGKGQFGVLLPQYSAGNFLSSVFVFDKPLTADWQKFEFTYKTDDRRVQRIAFGIRLWGKDTVATFDDASFTFDPAENPGIQLEQRIATTTLKFRIETRDAEALVFVNGKEVPPGKEPIVTGLGEGLISVTAKAKAVGANPSLAITIADHPETNGRWRVGAKEDANWMDAGFNDSAWPVATPQPDGFLWSKDTGAQTALFRQVLLWNETHYGPNRCVNPPVKEWGFARRSMESIYLALYSPLPYRLDDYEFTLDVPVEFRLLDKVNYKIRHIFNDRPLKIETETVKRDGRTYTRYRMFHSANEVTPEATHFSILPIQMVQEFKDPTCRFYFRRSARGNFTELEQSIPIRILPPINGRQPKHVMISQYSPMGYSYFSKEHVATAVKQASAAGWNYFMIGWSYGWGPDWRDYMKLWHDSVGAAGQHVILWGFNYPLYGTYATAHLQNVMYEWLEKNPAARARYFKDSVPWDQDHSMYCPTYVTTEGAETFRALTKKEYEFMLAFLPKSEIVFTDWESQPWVSPDGKGSWCFCDRCKLAFREFAKLPETTDLSDDSILKNYRVKWEGFRAQLDGKLQAPIHQVMQELSKPYLMYSWGSYLPFWEACRGNIDLAFAGVPGNSVADSHYQNALDESSPFFREKVGLKRVMGQRFSFFYGGNKDDWKVTVLSDDNFVHPRSWKSQILRIVAAYHGGVDLQNSNEYPAGSHYYIGEATRVISEFEPLFWDGERADDLASSTDIKYPNLLVLKLGRERLVLLFNEEVKPLRVMLNNKELQPGQMGWVYGTKQRTQQPAKMEIIVPAEDVAVVHIR